MRPYRQIAKNNSYLAAVSSGQSQGVTVLSEAITVNAKVYTPSGTFTSKQRVSDTLLAEIAKSFDAKYFTSLNTSSSELTTGAGLPYARKVSVHEEAVSENGSDIYTSLGEVSFWYSKKMISAGLFNTKIMSNPISIKKSGIIKSVGLNVITNSGTDVVAGTSVERRYVDIPNPGLNAFSSNFNFYYKAKSCFFSFVGANIYKIPFDMNTFTFGTPILISSSFAYNTNYGRFAATNLKNKVFKQINTTQFLVFNCDTETVTTVTCNMAIPSTYTLSWDRSLGRMRDIYNSSDKGFTITESGFITKGTGSLSSSSTPYISNTPSYIENNKIMDNGMIWLNNIVPGVNTIAQNLGAANSAALYAQPGYLMLNDDNTHIMFTSPSNVATMGKITFEKFSETMYTLIGNTPDIVVNAGDSISVEFEFNILK